MRFRLIVDGEPHELVVEGEPPRLLVRVDGVEYHAQTTRGADGFVVRVGPRRHRIAIRGNEATVDGVAREVTTESIDAGRLAPDPDALRPGAVLEIRPPMPGRIVKMSVGAGDRVKRGQTLAVLEAMKMQNEIPSPAEAIVRSVGVREGESIASDRVIAVLEAR